MTRLVRPKATGISFTRPAGLPALLVSYVYLKTFLQQQTTVGYRDWVMDSGAYSAHTLGLHIGLQDYIDCCKRLLDQDGTLREVFALDVIGDWRAGLKNCEAMWRAGIPAIPCYHPGREEPEDVLVGLARDYPKIALGGVVKVRAERKAGLLEQCFARVWPCKIHGFGIVDEALLLRLPFHSVDASTWAYRPSSFGDWHTFGNNMSVRGDKHGGLRAEVEWFLHLEQRVRAKWAPLMARLGWQDSAPSTVRLALASLSKDTREALPVAAKEAYGPAH